MRGEQQEREKHGDYESGSPPLARGTVVIEAKGRDDGGITPACAGNSYFDKRFTLPVWDHPRLRGEQGTYAKSFYSVMGSPPLARGTVSGYNQNESVAGITPACAGNRLPRETKLKLYGDHPRLRGEQPRLWSRACRHRGSPPLARGTALWVYMVAGEAGITPACAGNSSIGSGYWRLS